MFCGSGPMEREFSIKSGLQGTYFTVIHENIEIVRCVVDVKKSHYVRVLHHF